MAHPGKKLLFMGQEFAQAREWSHDRALDWGLLDEPAHAGVRVLVRDLNLAYRAEPALWQRDADPDGFSWIDRDESGDGVLAFARHGDEPDGRLLVCVANLAPAPRDGYRLGLPRAGRWNVAVDTDAAAYGGGGMGGPCRVEAETVASPSQPFSALVALPALSVLWLAPAT